jgi:hypothetical protein
MKWLGIASSGALLTRCVEPEAFKIRKLDDQSVLGLPVNLVEAGDGMLRWVSPDKIEKSLARGLSYVLVDHSADPPYRKNYKLSKSPTRFMGPEAAIVHRGMVLMCRD